MQKDYTPDILSKQCKKLGINFDDYKNRFLEFDRNQNAFDQMIEIL
jgi:hypothetical protein